MSVCQYVNRSICQYVSMSICQYVRMQLFSLGIKMKVVHNVIRMSDSQKILVRKSLRTAKEPALVFLNRHSWPPMTPLLIGPEKVTWRCSCVWLADSAMDIRTFENFSLFFIFKNFKKVFRINLGSCKFGKFILTYLSWLRKSLKTELQLLLPLNFANTKKLLEVSWVRSHWGWQVDIPQVEMKDRSQGMAKWLRRLVASSGPSLIPEEHIFDFRMNQCKFLTIPNFHLRKGPTCRGDT